MSTAHLFDSAFCVHLTWALLHFVWQGALIVGGSILAVWLLGRDSPQRRHRIYLTALLLMPLCLPVTLGVVVGWDADRGLSAAGADALASWPTEIGPEVASPDEIRRSSEVVTRPKPLAGSSEIAVTPRGITGEAWARWTALGYVLGVALMLSRVLLAVQGGRRFASRYVAGARARPARGNPNSGRAIWPADRAVSVLVRSSAGPRGDRSGQTGDPAADIPRDGIDARSAQSSDRPRNGPPVPLGPCRARVSAGGRSRALLSPRRVVRQSAAVRRAGAVLRRARAERRGKRPRICRVPDSGGGTDPSRGKTCTHGGCRDGAGPAGVAGLGRASVPDPGSDRMLAGTVDERLAIGTGLVLSLVAALVLGLAGSLSALAESASTTANTSLANGNEADQTAGESVDEQHAVAALRAMGVVKSGDLNTTPLRTADFWSVPTEAWPHIGRLLSLHELRIVASDVRGEPFEHIGRLKNLRRLTVINSKCSPTDLAQVKGLANLEYLEVVFTVLEESDNWRSKQLGPLTPVEQEQVDRYLASRPTAQAEQYRRMMEVAVLTDRGLRHLSGLKQLRTLKLINTNITGHGLDCLKDLPALEELDLPLIAFSPDVARVLGGMQSLRRFRYADVTDESLAEFARLSGLEELELFGDSVTDRGAEHLKRLVELRKLSIRGSQFTDQGLQQLAGLPHLEYLDVRHSVGSLSAAGVTQFQTQKPGCQVLFEPAAKQGDPPPVNPAAVPQDKGERGGEEDARPRRSKSTRRMTTGQTARRPGRLPSRLSLTAWKARVHRGTRVFRVMRETSDGEIIALRLEGVTLEKNDLALIGQLPELETLNLRTSNVTDEDLRPLGGLPRLRELRLGDTRIDGSGLEYLGSLEHLERLDLSDTEITDDSLRHLTKLRNLHHLRLTSARIGDSGLARSRADHQPPVAEAHLHRSHGRRVTTATRTERVAGTDTGRNQGHRSGTEVPCRASPLRVGRFSDCDRGGICGSDCA